MQVSYVRGQEAVLSALGHRRYFYPTRIQSEGTRNILRAMETHGVRRLVCVTSLGIGDTAGRLGLAYTCFVIPAILPFYFWDKTRQERLIAASAADWTIVRPGALTDGRKHGTVRHGSNVGSFHLDRARLPFRRRGVHDRPAHIGCLPENGSRRRLKQLERRAQRLLRAASARCGEAAR